MKIVLLDIEANGFMPLVDKLWCICTEDTDTGEQRDWTYPVNEDDFVEYCKTVDRWVIHNGSSYDGPVLAKLLPKTAPYFTTDKIIDTMVISRTTNYNRMRSHSLKNWGLMLGNWKGDWEDFSKPCLDMYDYCRQDVNVLKGVWSKLKKYCVGSEGTRWKPSFDLEKEMNKILGEVSVNGFAFNVKDAKETLSDIKDDMFILEAEFQKAWPPQLTESKRIKNRHTKDGTPYKNVTSAILSHPKTEVDGDELVCYDYEAFSPSSPKKRIDKLWDAGWKPYLKTKGHTKFLKERSKDKERAEKFSRYGWMCNEENLKTLPKKGSESASKLAQWLTLEGRRSSLEEWLGQVGDDGRIHGSIFHIGAWTHRCSHSGPNTANISSPWPKGKPAESGVDIVKEKYDSKLRSYWTVEKGNYLVGTDADGIQLRILADYMRSEEYRDAILKGDKATLTDIHSVNQKALGSLCETRDDAKTFIYAWLLGAGSQMVASILGCNVPQAVASVKQFLESLPELKRVKDVLIPKDAARGYFDGLDGRKLVQPEEYLMLAGYLQNGESTIMKRATVKWYNWAKSTGIDFKLVGFVHDEWQTEVNGSLADAEHIGMLQCKSLEEVGDELGLFCPISGSTDIGRNWLETH